MIGWVIAALLALSTGLRIGWALVNHQSVVSGAMMLALGSLAVLAALNWPPLTLLVDSVLRWPNAAVCLSEIALIASATGSCVMIVAVSSRRGASATRRLAGALYGAGAVIAVVTAALFFGAAQQPEMAPAEYLAHRLGGQSVLPWLVPLLYVMLVLTLVCWAGLRLSDATRRGRALFVFTAGLALIVGAGALLLIRAIGPAVPTGVAGALLLSAMATVGAGSLLPGVEDWIGARRELRLIGPLLREMQRRHPDAGIGERPRGPLVFRVAERLSLIADSLYLEASRTSHAGAGAKCGPPAGIDPGEQARVVARWVIGGAGPVPVEFPGQGWLRQPAECSDREWILEIARQYARLQTAGGDSACRNVAPVIAVRQPG